MIEDQTALITKFLDLGTRYRDSQDVMAAMAFDDATINLKRYVLSQLHDQALGSELARLPKLIRNRDQDGFCNLFDQIAAQLRAI